MIFAVPSIAPEGFTVEITNETSLDAHFSWQYIPQEFANGVLLGYRLTCMAENGAEVLSTITTGTSLQASNAFVSSNHYTCLLCGLTSVGCGLEAVEYISTYPNCKLHTLG